MNMKKNQAWAIATAFLALGISTAAGQEARMLNTREGILEWEYLDRIKNGLIPPTTIQSLSAKEASSYEIDTGLLPTEKATVTGKIIIQPSVLGWNEIDTSKRLTDASMLTRFHMKDPVLYLGVSFASPSFYGTTAIDFGTDALAAYADESGMTGFWKPLDNVSYWTFPEEGYLAWSGKNMTFAFGRFKTGIGLGESNIFLNGQARWYDQAQFSWWSERFRFFSFWGTSSAHLSNKEYEIQSFSKKDGNAWGWDTINNHDAATQSLVPLKMFTYHRFEFKPFSRIGFGLSEMQLIGGKEPDLMNLAPSVIWHNAYTAGVTNVMLHADTWFSPVKGLLVFGEFLMDDSKAPKEYGASKPNCWGWAAGSTYVLPLETEDWRYSVSVEYEHLDKWTYSRWQPYLTMYQRQLLTGGHEGFDIPLGHNEGGDVDQIGISLLAIDRKGRRIEIKYDFIDKGPVYLGMYVKNPDFLEGSGESKYIPVYYDFDNWTETGALEALLGKTRKYSNVFNLNAAWPLTPSMVANGEIDLRMIVNSGHVRGEKATELVYKIGLTWTYGK